ncbi:MAG: C-type lectin domain-containing protein [Kiritimatiellaeota bacterium]|nr:C-type lectin domain-containing protein [Kiritimatiellota bacterium]
MNMYGTQAARKTALLRRVRPSNFLLLNPVRHRQLGARHMIRSDSGRLRWAFTTTVLHLLAFPALAPSAEIALPPEFLDYPCQTAIEGKPFQSAPAKLARGESATFALLRGPKGMEIDPRTGSVRWALPDSAVGTPPGHDFVRVAAVNAAGRDEMEWVLQVCPKYIPDPQIVSTKYCDFVVPPEIAAWIRRYHAEGYIDGCWEYLYRLLGQEPKNPRQLYVCDPRHKEEKEAEQEPYRPLRGAANHFFVDPVRGWVLGYYFHEVGHRFLAAHTTSISKLSHLNRGSPSWAKPYIHALLPFLQAAQRQRAIDKPSEFGLIGESIENFRKRETWRRETYTRRIGEYQQWLRNGGNAEDWVKRKEADTFAVTGWMGILISDKYGPECIEKVIMTFRHDMLPDSVYALADTPLKKNTVLICAFSCAAKADLRPFFKEWGFASDAALYNGALPVVRKTVADLPCDEYQNGWLRCPQTGHLYRMMRWKTDWAEACRMARRAGGHLVTINSQEEDQWVTKRFGNDGPYWIGLSRKDDDKDWNWITVEPTTYQNWGDKPPRAKGKKAVACSGWKNLPGWSALTADRECVVIVEREPPVAAPPANKAPLPESPKATAGK